MSSSTSSKPPTDTNADAAADALASGPFDPGVPANTLPWLTAIMQRLLAPDGCPWDREQTLETLKGYLLEECYEVIDAIDSGSTAHHQEELGDLLFQIVFQAELAEIEMSAVIGDIGEKLIRRHPHVFGQVEVADSGEVLENWERIKARERGGERGALDGVPRSMPPLMRTDALLTRAERVGFRWPDSEASRAKVDEELAELEAARNADELERAEEELGDVLFALISHGRASGLDPVRALDGAALRFRRRFEHLEGAARAQAGSVDALEIDKLLALWREAKSAVG